MRQTGNRFCGMMIPQPYEYKNRRMKNMMKKTLTVMCAAVRFVFAAFPACAAGASLVGDVNLDGKITNTDMLLLKQHIVETTVLTGQSFNNADINGDDRITTTDVQMLNHTILN